GFNDSAWLSGPGGFTGGETAANLLPVLNSTSLPAPAAGSQNPAGHAMYFRKHFTIGATNSLTLIASNAIDDGAVIYLNGTRILSLRGPADGACASFSTGGAIGANTDALLWEVSTLGPAQYGGILIPNGDNVLAVSVHQINVTSSDMVFAMALMSSNSVPNSLPSVTVTNPVNGATFVAPASF